MHACIVWDSRSKNYTGIVIMMRFSNLLGVESMRGFLATWKA